MPATGGPGRNGGYQRAPRHWPWAAVATLWARVFLCATIGAGGLPAVAADEPPPPQNEPAGLTPPAEEKPAPPAPDKPTPAAEEKPAPPAVPSTAKTPAAVPPPAAVPSPPAPPADATKKRFTAEVRAARAPASKESEHFSLSGEPLRTAPGTLGDPFRVIALLPGVTSPLPGLPIYAIRGASPGTSGFFLDGMQLPQLFHLLIGGSVVYASLIDQVDFYPSGYDASIGRLAGGAITATTRPARDDGNHVELGVRVYDVSGVVELKLPKDVRITVSGHYGYPGPILSAIDDRIHLSYWDYMLRLDRKGLTVEALGSYDSLEVKNVSGSVYVSPQNSRLMFHRLQVRQRFSRGPLQLEAALHGGYDEAGDVSGRGVRKLAFGWRANFALRWSRLKLQGGVDGEIAQFDGQRFDLGLRNLAFVRDAEGPARVSGKDPDHTPDELGDLGQPRIGVTNSVWAQGSVELFPKRATLTVGARLDTYAAAGVTLLGVDPRAQLDLVLTPWLRMHIGGGVYQQPPSFPLLLPGIDTFALQLGLQRATGGAITEELKLPAGISLSVAGFYQKFNNVTDLPPLGVLVCAPPPPESLTGTTATLMRVTDGDSYGMEVLVRRTQGRFTGWLSYTLSRSERNYPCGVRPADYDQTHALNVVAQIRLPRGFVIGGHLMYQTGRPETLLPANESVNGSMLGQADTSLNVRNNIRLPDYVQLDLRVDKTWQLRRIYVAAFLEVINATFSRTNLYLSYPDAENGTPSGTYGKPEIIGFSWILPSIGVRGGF